MAVLLEHEIVLGQVADQGAMFVAHGSKHGHELHVYRDRGALLLTEQGHGCEQWETCTKQQS